MGLIKVLVRSILKFFIMLYENLVVEKMIWVDVSVFYSMYIIVEECVIDIKVINICYIKKERDMW